MWRRGRRRLRGGGEDAAASELEQRTVPTSSGSGGAGLAAARARGAGGFVRVSEMVEGFIPHLVRTAG
jgi:hypothetical protein